MSKDIARTFSRAFRLKAIERMDAGENVSALSRKLGVKREILYRWRSLYRAGGEERLREQRGRPTIAEAHALAAARGPSVKAADLAEARRQIAELERKIGRQQLDPDFFKGALRHIEVSRRPKKRSGATASSPNRKWIADFTYIWTAEGWRYVAAVLDLFSRRVVGWSMSASMTAQLVTDALVMAIWRRGKPDALLHHSDRGSRYTSAQFQRLLADHGVTCSMSRSGNCWGNAAMESFFSSLKTERTARKTYRTRDEAKADAFDYIERFYNPVRRYSTIGYISPMEFKMQTGLP